MDEFKRRLSAAKKHRSESLEGEGREVYKYCFNGREEEWDSRVSRNDDADEIFTDFPSTIAEEFAGELFTTMTPENTPWVQYEPSGPVDERDADGAKQQLEQYEEIIHAEIRRSNYYDEGLSAFMDAVVGNVAMWIDKPTLNSPAVCETIALPELYLRLGHNGIDDRFRVQKYDYQDLPGLFPDAQFPKELVDKIKGTTRGKAKVCWGFWRSYDDVENPKWLQRIRVDDKEIGMDIELAEDGSCPIVVGRFNATARSAWGRGPGRRMLPTIRVLNELTSMNLEGMDRTLDPAYVYAHDGMLDLSEGIEAGMGYPAMPGSGDSIRALGLEGSLDYGFFSEEAYEERIRDGFYREMMQRGKTPPSASQYVGDQQKQLRRMARPGAKTWREFGVGILKRFEYLARQSGGGLEGVDIPLLDSGTIIARPISPLERAQAGEDVMVAQSIMAMAMETFGPQMAALQIDGEKTMTNVKTTLKDKIVEFRSQEDMERMMAAQQQDPSNAEANQGSGPPA